MNRPGWTLPVTDWIRGQLRMRGLRLAVLFVGVLLPLWLFGELAEEVGQRDVMAFDETILRFMQANASAALDRLMLFASEVGSGTWVTLVDVVVFVALTARQRRADALFWALATGGAALLNALAKHSFARARPDLWVSIAPESSYSFPSGHTMQTMALAAAVVVLLWPTRARWAALAAGLLFTGTVGISRIYLGVHFPSDVLAGWSASLAWVVGLALVFHRLAARRRNPG